MSERVSIQIEGHPDILPCPFCGGEAALEEVKQGGAVSNFTVGCLADEVDCMGYQSLTTFARRSEAIAAWNRRAPGSPLPAAPPRTQTAWLVEMIAAAEAQGTSLGQLLYDACAGPFAYRGRWDAPGRSITRDNYQAAAKAFVRALWPLDVGHADRQSEARR